MNINIKLKKETRYLAGFFYIVVVLMYFVALMTVSCCAELFPDRQTGLFWFSEIMNSANRILFIGIVVCIFSERLI